MDSSQNIQIKFIDELKKITAHQKQIIKAVIIYDSEMKKNKLNGNKEEINKLPKAWLTAQSNNKIIEKIYSTLVKVNEEVQLFMIDHYEKKDFQINEIQSYKEHIKKKLYIM